MLSTKHRELSLGKPQIPPALVPVGVLASGPRGILHLHLGSSTANYSVGEGGKGKLSLGELCWQTTHESLILLVLGNYK